MVSILKNYSILYVEDEPAIQADMKEYLQSYFKEVFLASDGEEALTLYEQYQPDVLLLDIGIPKISGLSVAKSIRQENSKVKILMLTAHSEVEVLLEATELKLTKYILKPISPKIFKESMRLLAHEFHTQSSNCIKLDEHTFWDKETKTLMAYNKKISLREKELKLLELFLTHKASTISYEDIMVAIWEDSFEREISIDSVKNQVSQLRKKLPKDIISSVYGQGYIFH